MEKLTMTQEMIKRQLEKVEDSSQNLKRAFNEPDLTIKDYFIFPEGIFYTRSYFHKYHANGNIISGNYPYKKEVYEITFNSKTIWELKWENLRKVHMKKNLMVSLF